MKKCDCSRTVIKKIRSLEKGELEIVVCVKCKKYIVKGKV